MTITEVVQKIREMSITKIHEVNVVNPDFPKVALALSVHSTDFSFFNESGNYEWEPTFGMLTSTEWEILTRAEVSMYKQHRVWISAKEFQDTYEAETGLPISESPSLMRLMDKLFVKQFRQQT